MKLFHQVDIRKLLKQINSEGVSMRRRFIVYFISIVAMALSLILLLLNLFGILNPTKMQVMNTLDAQLVTYADSIEHDYDKIAAYAISFSAQLEAGIQNYLTRNNITFDDLKNNTASLTELQSDLYDIVYLHMQLAPSSGAFYILDTTVNSKSETPLYNGIYLKYINISSESTVNNEITLYRGSFTTGKDSNLTFHSGWQNEMQTDFFDNCDNAFNQGTHYILSPTLPIPDTWERARYVYVPIHDLKGNIIGVCGFEVNDLYFQLSKKANDGTLGQLVCALLDKKQNVYSGQFNSGRYNTANSVTLKATQNEEATIFDFGTDACIGKTASITLGNDDFTVALMLPLAQYHNLIQQGQMQTAGIILFVVIFAFVCCVLMSKKYVSPIIKSLEQIKTKEDYDNQLRIREIDDLFAFLEEKDTIYEKQLEALEKAKQIAEEETQRTKEAYEKTLEKYALAQNEIQQLMKGHKKDIVLEDYEFFICNLGTLTPTEYRIYELYLAGKTAKEIVEIMSITENTLKYHNKNIYSKLGISSRKQLLRFAALKQQQDMLGTSNT